MIYIEGSRIVIERLGSIQRGETDEMNITILM